MPNDIDLGAVLDGASNALSPMDHETDPAECRIVFVDDDPSSASFRDVFCSTVDPSNGVLVNPAILVDGGGRAVLLHEFSNGAEWSRAFDLTAGRGVSRIYFSGHQTVSRPNIDNVKIRRCVETAPDVWTVTDVIFDQPPELGLPGGQVVQRLLLNASYSELLTDRVLIYCRLIVDITAGVPLPPGVVAAWGALVGALGSVGAAAQFVATDPRAKGFAAAFGGQAPVHWVVDDPLLAPLDDDGHEIPNRFASPSQKSFTVRPIPDAYAVVYAQDDSQGGMNLVWFDLRAAGNSQFTIKQYPNLANDLIGVGARRVPGLDHLYGAGAAYVVYAVFHDPVGGVSSYDSFLVYYDYVKVYNGQTYSMAERDIDLAFADEDPLVSRVALARAVELSPTTPLPLTDDENFMDYSTNPDGDPRIVFLTDDGTNSQFLVASAVFDPNNVSPSQNPLVEVLASDQMSSGPGGADQRDAEPLYVPPQLQLGTQTYLYYRHKVAGVYRFRRFEP